MIAYQVGQGLYLNITNRCPNDCEFCVRRFGTGIAGQELWLEREPTAEEIIAAAGDPQRYSELVFCGFGEPLSRLETVVTVGHALKARGAVRIRIDTNGLAALIHGHDVVPKLVDWVDAVSVSLNAPDATAYDALCHPIYSGAYEAVEAFIRSAVRAGLAVTATCVDYPGVDVAACAAKAAELGAAFRVRHFSRDL